MPSPETIAAIFTGLTGLIAALAAFTANRSRRVAADQRALRRRVRKLERQLVALTEHIFVLEMEIARSGGRVPERPPELENMDADDDEEAIEPSAAPGQPAAGRHRG